MEVGERAMGDIGEPQRHFEVLPQGPSRAQPQQAPHPMRTPDRPLEPSQPKRAPSEPAR